jgi:hypothetical protein
MKKKYFILALFLLVLCSGIGIVSAETLTGTLGSANVTSQNFQATSNDATGSNTFIKVGFKNIENAYGLSSVVGFTNTGLFGTDALAPAGAQTTFTLTNETNVTKGSGTIQYQKVFNSIGDQIPNGYIALVFSQPLTDSIAGLSGDKVWNIHYSRSALYNVTLGSTADGGQYSIPAGRMAFVVDGCTGLSGPSGGQYMLFYYNTNNFNYNFVNTYEVSKPSGIGITGWVNKSSGGTNYPSRVYIFNVTGEIPITNEGLVTNYDFSFGTIKEQIRIGVKDSQNNWYNTSTLFSAGSGTPTPTPTVTPVPTIAPGYVRTNVHVWDRGGNMIHGANIDIKDIGNSSWSNSTHDADGISYIDTLPYHQINIYGSYDVFENEFLPNSLLNQDTGPAGYTYYLTLYPYESGVTEGNVSLYVEVKDADSGSYIPYANVQIVLSNGYSYSGSTANLGSKVFIVPNDTVVHATGTASGFLPATVVGNSGSGGSLTMTVSLHKQVVTTRPTSTIPPGGVTPAVTVDPRTASQKDADMMEMIRDSGPNLIQLAIAVTMISLLGLMTKGFGK